MNRLLLALACSVAAFAEDSDSASLEDLVARLRHRSLRVREEAVEALVQRGAPAVPLLAPLVDEKDARVQRAAVEALARIGTRDAIRPIVHLVEHDDPGIRDTVRLAFRRGGRACRDLLREEAKDNPGSRDAIEAALQEITSAEIEEFFDTQVTAGGQSGFYMNQFAKLRDIEDAGPVLTKMLENQDFPFESRDAGRRIRYREMAANAIGELKYEGAVTALQNMDTRMDGGSSRVGLCAAAALYRLGKPEKIREIEGQVRQQIEAMQAQPAGVAYQYSYLAEVYSRVDELENAVEAYEEAIRLSSTDAQVRQSREVMHYNLACSLARLGKKQEALAHLVTAVDQGYNSLDWLQLDRDLDSIRGEPEFAEILKRLGGNAEAPPAESGGTDEGHDDGGGSD